MKRYGNLYEGIYDLENIRRAYKNARKGKSYYKEVKEIDLEPEKYFIEIHDMLKNNRFKTGEYQVFKKIDKGKEREIYRLPFYPDRIVHWCIIQILEPIFLNKLNHCTHSAIPKRGIHSAFRQLDNSMKDKIGTQFCLKLDVKKFYPSINHEVLKDMYCGMFKDKRLLDLLFEIIDSVDSESGVPIGNYISQYSGNLYLYKFDRWIKEDLKIKHYIRYMDDICIFSDNKEVLHSLFESISNYFTKKLKIEIKDNYQIFPSRIRGVDFVGYRHFGDYVLLRDSTKRTMKKKMRHVLKKVENGELMSHSDWCSVNSYKGWLKWCSSHNLYIKWIKPLEKYCDDYYKKEVKNETI